MCHTHERNSRANSPGKFSVFFNFIHSKDNIDTKLTHFPLEKKILVSFLAIRVILLEVCNRYASRVLRARYQRDILLNARMPSVQTFARDFTLELTRVLMMCVVIYPHTMFFQYIFNIFI